MVHTVRASALRLTFHQDKGSRWAAPAVSRSAEETRRCSISGIIPSEAMKRREWLWPIVSEGTRTEAEAGWLQDTRSSTRAAKRQKYRSWRPSGWTSRRSASIWTWSRAPADASWRSPRCGSAEAGTTTSARASSPSPCPWRPICASAWGTSSIITRTSGSEDHARRRRRGRATARDAHRSPAGEQRIRRRPPAARPYPRSRRTAYWRASSSSGTTGSTTWTWRRTSAAGSCASGRPSTAGTGAWGTTGRASSRPSCCQRRAWSSSETRCRS